MPGCGTVHEENHRVVHVRGRQLEQCPLLRVPHPPLSHDPDRLRDHVHSGHLVPPRLQDQRMGTHTRPEIEDSRTTMPEGDQLPLFERVLTTEKKRRTDFFRRAEVVSDRDRDVLPAIVECGEGRPERRPRPDQTRTGVATRHPRLCIVRPLEPMIYLRPYLPSSRAFSRSSRPSIP